MKMIYFKIDLKGSGIVNFDSSEQKVNYPIEHRLSSEYNNVSYAKKNFSGDPKNPDYKIKISSFCLKRNIFRDSKPFYAPNMLVNTNMIAENLASPDWLLTGHMFTSKKGTTKRKSAICLPFAQQTCDGISQLETHSNSGPKDTDKNTKDNTYYYRESIGDVEYKAKGSIDLKTMQFISCDQLFDRCALKEDDFGIFEKYLKIRMPSFNSKVNYYRITSSINTIPERGIVLSNDDLTYLVRYFFKLLLGFRINSSNGYVETHKVQYKIVNDFIKDKLLSDDNWITLESESDVDSIYVDVEDFYTLVSDDNLIEIRNTLEDKANNARASKDEEVNIDND